MTDSELCQARLSLGGGPVCILPLGHKTMFHDSGHKTQWNFDARSS